MHTVEGPVANAAVVYTSYSLLTLCCRRRWECSFETEYPSADVMRGALRARCESGIRGLGTWLSLRGAPTGPPSWGSSGSPGSPSKKRAPPVIGAVGPAGVPAVAISASAHAAAAPQLLGASHAAHALAAPQLLGAGRGAPQLLAHGALQPGAALLPQAGLAALQPGNVPMQPGALGMYGQGALAPAQPLGAASLGGAAAYGRPQLQAQAGLALNPNPAAGALNLPLQAAVPPPFGAAAANLGAAPDLAQHAGASRGLPARPVSLRRGHTDSGLDNGGVVSPRSSRGVAVASKLASC